MRRTDREQEFSDFFLARGPALRRTAYLVVRDWHTAEDLTQQAFVKLYAAWPRVRRDSAEAYARKVVVNQCLSHLRKHRPEAPTEHVPDLATSSPYDDGLDTLRTHLPDLVLTEESR